MKVAKSTWSTDIKARHYDARRHRALRYMHTHAEYSRVQKRIKNLRQIYPGLYGEKR